MQHNFTLFSGAQPQAESIGVTADGRYLLVDAAALAQAAQTVNKIG